MSKCWNGKVQEHELVRRTFVTLIQVEFGSSEPDDDFFVTFLTDKFCLRYFQKLEQACARGSHPALHLLFLGKL